MDLHAVIETDGKGGSGFKADLPLLMTSFTNEAQASGSSGQHGDFEDVHTIKNNPHLIAAFDDNLLGPEVVFIVKEPDEVNWPSVNGYGAYTRLNDKWVRNECPFNDEVFGDKERTNKNTLVDAFPDGQFFHYTNVVSNADFDELCTKVTEADGERYGQYEGTTAVTGNNPLWDNLVSNGNWVLQVGNALFATGADIFTNLRCEGESHMCTTDEIKFLLELKKTRFNLHFAPRYQEDIYKALRNEFSKLSDVRVAVTGGTSRVDEAHANFWHFDSEERLASLSAALKKECDDNESRRYLHVQASMEGCHGAVSVDKAITLHVPYVSNGYGVNFLAGREIAVFGCVYGGHTALKYRRLSVMLRDDGSNNAKEVAMVTTTQPFPGDHASVHALLALGGGPTVAQNCVRFMAKGIRVVVGTFVHGKLGSSGGTIHPLFFAGKSTKDIPVSKMSSFLADIEKANELNSVIIHQGSSIPLTKVWIEGATEEGGEILFDDSDTIDVDAVMTALFRIHSEVIDTSAVVTACSTDLL